MSIDSFDSKKTSPKIFYRGKYAFRSMNEVEGVITQLVLCVVFVAFTLFVFQDEGWNEDFFAKLFFDAFSITFTLIAIYLSVKILRTMWDWITNAHLNIEINEQGAQIGKRFWSWEHILQFEGAKHNAGIALIIQVPTRIKSISSPVTLPTTPWLTDEEYAALTEELSKFLSAQFPDTKVLTEPKNESGTILGRGGTVGGD